MSASGAAELDRFRFLATFVAGRSIDIAAAPEGQPAHTNGTAIFVTGSGSDEQIRREVVLHSALIGAGSLQEPLVRPLRARPALARRYLAVEGRRVLVDLAQRLPLAATLHPEDPHGSTSAAQSLEIARSRTRVSDAPDFFGILKPSALLSTVPEPGTRASDADLRFTPDPAAMPVEDGDDDDDEGPSEESKILKMFDNPLSTRKRSGTSCANCSAHRGRPATVQAGIRRPKPCGGSARAARTPGRCPTGSTSPTTNAQVPPSGWAERCIPSGTSSAAGTGRTGAG